jgi:hypothetical protein
MTKGENTEYFYLQYKFANKDSISENDKLRLDELQKKYIEENQKRAYWTKYVEDKRKAEEIYKQITKDVKFISKFVKKAQSIQTGEKTVFYDIDIEKMPSTGTWGEFNQLYNKYNQLRGRSLNLSMYASIKQSMFLDDSVRCYIIPALKYAYENYVRDNFYGKEVEFEEYPGHFVKAKAFQIDWFDEVYISKEKFKTTFQGRIEEIEKKYNSKIENYFEYLKEHEPESWERAWIDYVERYDIHDYLFNCQEMIKHPENFSGIKNIDEYIREAENITHRKFRKYDNRTS